MSFNGSGTFVINSSGQPVVANTVISSTVFNALTADLATGLSTCITKDGQTTPTANIPMGTFKFTNLGVGSAATDSATLGQVQASTTKLVTVSGTDTITGTMTPALTAYASGQMFYFVAGGANTGAVTLNIDGLGARNVTRHGSVALVAGDILSGEVCVVVYDGTRFQLLNPASYTNLNVTGVLSLAAGTALLPSLAFSGDLNTGVWSPAADTIAASTGGSERLRVDSGGNLGIGTASPAAKLHVVGNQYRQTDATASFGFVVNTTTATTRLETLFGGSSFAVRTNGDATDKLLLDSSGNLGIGTASPAGRVDSVSNATAAYAARASTTGANQTVNALNAYNADASLFALAKYNAVQHIWGYNGTTEGMRLDGSGNLGIGTSSPAVRVHAYSGTAMAQMTVDGIGAIKTGINFANGGVTYGQIYFDNVGPYDMTVFQQYTTGSLRLGTNNTERMRITSEGNIVAGASAALATNATNGFLYVPTCAGTPTGTPTAITGMAPIVVNTTNNKLYFYSGGAWRDAGP